jgi:hypothetical protein
MDNSKWEAKGKSLDDGQVTRKTLNEFRKAPSTEGVFISCPNFNNKL